MASSRRGRFIAVVIALAAIAVVALCVSLWVNEGPMWRWVMTDVVVDEEIKKLPGWPKEEKVRCYGRNDRWDGTRIQDLWFSASTGYLCRDQRWSAVETFRITVWGQDGKIAMQGSARAGKILVANLEPPWLWGVTDQTEPTDPQWIAEHGKQ